MNKHQHKPTHNKKPRIDEVIADRNPLRRLKVTPVDLYQVPPGEVAHTAAPSETEPPRTSEAPAERRQAHDRGTAASKTAGTGSSEVADSLSTAAGEGGGRREALEDVVLPYSTRIRRSLIRAIRVMAFNSDRKDREIVEAGLEEYFERHSMKL